jgi:hypothetical protein
MDPSVCFVSFLTETTSSLSTRSLTKNIQTLVRYKRTHWAETALLYLAMFVIVFPLLPPGHSRSRRTAYFGLGRYQPCTQGNSLLILISVILMGPNRFLG